MHIHAYSIQTHGGSAGIRDIGLLESALTQAQNLYAYAKADVFQLAAAYAVGIARNHPFVDGNKRTAYSVANLFLDMNGYKLLVAKPDEHITYFEDVAASKITQDDLVAFYQARVIFVVR